MTDLGNILGMRIVEKLYDDALSPSVKQIGKATENAVKTLLIAGVPFQISGAAYDWITRKIERKFRAIPEDQRQPVHPAIAAPVIEQLRYHQEDEPLAEMFVQLLATAMEKTTANAAHPAFAKIIPQLAPDEALVLHIFSEREEYEERHITQRDPESFVTKSSEFFSQDFPVDRLTYPENHSVYFAHLNSLGLLTGMWKRNEDLYTEGGEFRREAFMQVHYRKLTEFGWLFERACDPYFRELEKD